MNQALKQRLVGAVVLAALAVIFLPALFNGGRPKQLDTLKEVPPMPATTPFVVQEPSRPPGAADEKVTPVSEMYAMDPKPTGAMEKIHQITQTTVASGQPGLNKKGIPNAWALQVGVFSDKTKADALKKSLQAKGYRAFTRTITRDKKDTTRVMIGPELDQSAVTKIKIAVDKEFVVKSIIVKFEA